MAETAKDGARHATLDAPERIDPEALRPTRSSDVLPRIARERVPTMGRDLIPYVHACGGLLEWSDELISLHCSQIFKGFVGRSRLFISR